MLIPLVFLLPHNPHCMVSLKVDTETQQINYTALTPISQGCAVSYDFDTLNNAPLLLVRGEVLSNNPYDTLTVEIEPAEDSSLKQKQKIMELLELSLEHRILGGLVYHEWQFPAEFFHTVRIILLDKKEAARYCHDVREKIKNGAEPHSLIRQVISAENEKSMCEHLKGIFSEMLSYISPSLEENIQRLNSQNLSTRTRLATLYKVGQQQILVKCLSRLETM